jgi:hypothetical protein
VRKFNQMLLEIINRPDSSLQIKQEAKGIEVTFRNGRRQMITVESQSNRYILTSMVLKQKQVQKIGRSQVLARLWHRNRETDVVTYSLNKKGQLIGQIEQLEETIDPEELYFYLEVLARECDQFEYALTGEDIQ